MVSGVERVVAKRESSPVRLGRREPGVQVMRSGSWSREAVQGIRRKGDFESSVGAMGAVV